MRTGLSLEIIELEYLQKTMQLNLQDSPTEKIFTICFRNKFNNKTRLDRYFRWSFFLNSSYCLHFNCVNLFQDETFESLDKINYIQYNYEKGKINIAPKKLLLSQEKILDALKIKLN